MRLINVETCEIEEFLDADLPAYAILSHTWGHEEVEFFEWLSPSAKLKQGYAKIWGARDQARQDGFPYVWVDTCCIDKRSSAELSEAINSMFAWYRDADLCYVYLADVDSLEDLATSKWFTRGWTLQELLAPQEIQFFSRSWTPLGTKKMLAEQLSRITHIGVPYLTGEDLRTASIAQRMSWASTRMTKRREDIAYCLLGIFDINMPLLYGEGEKAFLRLQEEILKKTSDESIFAWWESQAQKPTAGKKDRRTIVTDGRLGLLARSPRVFASSATVVAWPEDGDQFGMTNTSVELKSYENCPIEPPSSSWKYVRLRCRDLKRLSSFICIPVTYLPDLGIYCRLSIEVPLFVLPIRDVSLVWPLSWFGQTRTRDIVESRILVSKERPIIPRKLLRPTFDILVEYSFLQPKRMGALAMWASAIDFRPTSEFAGANARFDPTWQGIKREDSSEGFAARISFFVPNGKRIALYLECAAVSTIQGIQISDPKSLRIDHLNVVDENGMADVSRRLADFQSSSALRSPITFPKRRPWQKKLHLDGFRIVTTVKTRQHSEAADSAYTVMISIEPSEPPWASIMLYTSVLLLAMGTFWLRSMVMAMSEDKHSDYTRS